MTGCPQRSDRPIDPAKITQLHRPDTNVAVPHETVVKDDRDHDGQLSPKRYFFPVN